MANNVKSTSSMTKFLIIGCVFVAIIAVFVIKGINSYKERLFELSYKNTISKIEDAMTSMNAVGTDYFHSPLFAEREPADYSKKPMRFFEEIVGISKNCGVSNGSCFALKYKDENNKEYTPEYKGSCVILKSGPVMCMIPQIKNNNIKGIIDLNGKAAPNVLGKDLRTFEIKAKVRNYDPDTDDETERSNFIMY